MAFVEIMKKSEWFVMNTRDSDDSDDPDIPTKYIH